MGRARLAVWLAVLGGAFLVMSGGCVTGGAQSLQDLGSSDPLVRQRAREALQARGAGALGQIESGLEGGAMSKEAKIEALAIAGEIGSKNPKAADDLMSACIAGLRDKDIDVRKSAMAALAYGGKSVAPLIAGQLLATDDENIRVGLATAARIIGDVAPVRQLIGVVRDNLGPVEQGQLPQAVVRATNGLIALTGRRSVPLSEAQSVAVRVSIVKEWLSWWLIEGDAYRYP